MTANRLSFSAFSATFSQRRNDGMMVCVASRPPEQLHTLNISPGRHTRSRARIPTHENSVPQLKTNVLSPGFGNITDMRREHCSKARGHDDQ